MKKTDYIEDGLHYLSGIMTIEKYGNDGIRFILDDETYECIENPDDGWRSYGELYPIEDECAYKFPPQPVKSEYIDNGYKWILTLYDYETNKEILKIGTENYDDWYPMAIFEYTPENMSINL